MNFKLLTMAAFSLVGVVTCNQQTENDRPRRLRASGSNIKRPTSGSRHSAWQKEANIALKEKAAASSMSYSDDYYDDDYVSMSMGVPRGDEYLGLTPTPPPSEDEDYDDYYDMSMSMSMNITHGDKYYDDEDYDDYYDMSMSMNTTDTGSHKQSNPTIDGQDKDEHPAKIY